MDEVTVQVNIEAERLNRDARQRILASGVSEIHTLTRSSATGARRCSRYGRNSAAMSALTCSRPPKPPTVPIDPSGPPGGHVENAAMNRLVRVWNRFEEGAIAFLLAAMTLVTFLYVVMTNVFTLFYDLGDRLPTLRAPLYSVGDAILG